MISKAVTGHHQEVFQRPVLPFAVRAAPVRMMASMVMLLMSSITDPNHAWVRFGLKRLRVTISTGCGTEGSFRVHDEPTSFMMISWM